MRRSDEISVEIMSEMILSVRIPIIPKDMIGAITLSLKEMRLTMVSIMVTQFPFSMIYNDLFNLL